MPSTTGGLTFMVRISSGAPSEFVGIDPFFSDRTILRDPILNLLANLGLIEFDALDVKVETALVLANLPAGNRLIDRRTEEMKGRVHAHKAMAARPIDLGDQARADVRTRRSI